MKKILCCVLIVLLFTGCINEPFEVVNDTAPPLVTVDDHMYWINYGYDYIIDAPDEELWAGTITSTVPYNRTPTENGQTNQECCLNKPYAFLNGQLVIYIENVPIRLPDGTMDYGYDGWFKCNLYE